MWRYVLSISVLLCVSCSGQKQESTTSPATTKSSTAATTSSSSDFDKLTDDLLYGSLALSPVTATQTGYHEHNGVQLDQALDDYSQMVIERQRQFYEGIQSRIA